MARTVKPEEYAAKRREILNATQRLVLSKGYEQISIQDILKEVQISSGAFHHYFDSRRALLEAFVEQIKQEFEKPLLPIIHDPHLSASQKLQGFFDTLDRLRTAHKADVIKLGLIWYSDANALVRVKVEEAIFEQRAAFITEIVKQGIQEGSFTTTYPDKAGEATLSLLQGMGNAHAKLLLSLDQGADEKHVIEEIVRTHHAYMDAVERVLGVRENTLYRVNAEAVKFWVAAIRDKDAV
ncbi:TetR/AcrR family transcriptional regulator [Ktedonosporobacter rubrisoli]|uniref:TetR/AcrR family transcriptional regulator n=1 Tax=Ktedonosporobacter rubrisoli TaxID=2509675 RepID=A0A4P6JQU0_KTERU|nr:TetR/AcrR family transcriptional regulator [Ktedonosporobacter rubrisoli]QBD77136.1 TetR/AcrR family transcriptional regulator [Ktedonosporobacter rubrisoli]